MGKKELEYIYMYIERVDVFQRVCGRSVGRFVYYVPNKMRAINKLFDFNHTNEIFM